MIILFGGPGFNLLRWTEPEKADRTFYKEIKEKLAKYPDLKFESEVNFWKSFWPYLIAFIIFSGSAIWLITILRRKIEDNDLLGASLFLVCFSLYPTIYGVTKIIYYSRYRRQEMEYHSRFIDAVKKSKDYDDFIRDFYSGNFTRQS
jgi:amino acid permease